MVNVLITGFSLSSKETTANSVLIKLSYLLEIFLLTKKHMAPIIQKKVTNISTPRELPRTTANNSALVNGGEFSDMYWMVPKLYSRVPFATIT